MLTTLHSFDGMDGYYLIGGLFQATNGTFYGITPIGGSSADGTIFSLSIGLGAFAEPRAQRRRDFEAEGKPGGPIAESIMRYRVVVPDQDYFDRNIPCRTACPIHTECGRYVQAVGCSKDEEAYLLARAPNPFVYVLGRICAHPCEDACRRGKIDEPIAICALKRYVTDRHNLGSGHDPARKRRPPSEA